MELYTQSKIGKYYFYIASAKEIQVWYADPHDKDCAIIMGVWRVKKLKNKAN